MDDWIKRTVNPKIAKITGEELDLYDALKESTMCMVLNCGLQKFITEHATSSFVDAAIRAMAEDEQKIVDTNKNGFEGIVKGLTFGRLLEGLFDD